MANPTKRHYRVAQRDKALDEEYALVNEETIKGISLLGLLMYTFSILMSFTLGYVIGNQK
ncbi:MAG: hypothetical protein RR324_05145 [Cellulosilyticaceae bacterium]